jgi:hypothetical protein
LILVSGAAFAKNIILEKKVIKGSEKIVYKGFTDSEESYLEDGNYYLYVDGTKTKQFGFFDGKRAILNVPDKFTNLEVKQDGKALLLIEKSLINEIMFLLIVVLSIVVAIYVRKKKII